MSDLGFRTTDFRCNSQLKTSLSLQHTHILAGDAMLGVLSVSSKRCLLMYCAAVGRGTRVFNRLIFPRLHTLSHDYLPIMLRQMTMAVYILAYLI